MFNYLKITLGIFLILSTSRFVPHPPNFTSLMALSFYIPVFLGIRFLPALIIGFIITDLFIGIHNTVIFTWGSVIIIALISKYFVKNIFSRVIGALTGATIFFIISNFGVWTFGSYGLTINGLIICYTVALPFFAYNLISTFIFSSIIESIYKLKTNFINSSNNY
jgi:hypothetical protein